MINKTQAIKLAEKYIDERKNGYDIIVDYKNIYEEMFGWVFSFGLREVLEGKNMEILISGIVPIIIDKNRAEIIETGSRLSVEQYIALYNEVNGDKDLFNRRKRL